jgi:hypothetical protein
MQALELDALNSRSPQLDDSHPVGARSLAEED